MNARFAEFNGRISLIVRADTEHEMLLMKLFVEQCASPDLCPVQLISNGSSHNNTPDGGYGITSRTVHFGQYSDAEIAKYKSAEDAGEVPQQALDEVQLP